MWVKVRGGGGGIPGHSFLNVAKSGSCYIMQQIMDASAGGGARAYCRAAPAAAWSFSARALTSFIFDVSTS
jgi:hypothetical protein